MIMAAAQNRCPTRLWDSGLLCVGKAAPPSCSCCGRQAQLPTLIADPEPLHHRCTQQQLHVGTLPLEDISSFVLLHLHQVCYSREQYSSMLTGRRRPTAPRGEAPPALALLAALQWPEPWRLLPAPPLTAQLSAAPAPAPVAAHQGGSRRRPSLPAAAAVGTLAAA